MKKIYLLASFLVAIFCNTAAQTVKVPPTLDRWDTVGVNFTTETYMGKESILLKSGFISVKDSDLRDGTIEADISFPQ